VSENLFDALLPKTGAAMKRGKSKQDYETPDDFFAACVKRFGSFFCDLAATAENRKVDRYIGPDVDSLQQDWTKLRYPEGRSRLWLNPPFDACSRPRASAQTGSAISFTAGRWCSG
jgi:hypothetical protein